MRIEPALVSRPDDRCEDLLRLGTARGAIRAADLAGHDRRLERVFSAPVGHVDPHWVEEKAKQRRPLNRQERGEPRAGVGPWARGRARVRTRQSITKYQRKPSVFVTQATTSGRCR